MERGKSGKKSFTLLSRSFLDCVQFLTRIWEVVNSHQKEKHIFHMKNKDQISTITYNIFHQHDRHNCWGGKKIESNLIVHEKYIFWSKLCMLCWASWSSSWRENYATRDDGRCEKMQRHFKPTQSRAWCWRTIETSFVCRTKHHRSKIEREAVSQSRNEK